MFKSLKEKLSGWFAKKKKGEEEIVEGAKKELKRREKKREKKLKEKVLKISEKEEQEKEPEAEKIIEEVEEESPEEQDEELIEEEIERESKEVDEKKEKEGFFSRLKRRIMLSQLEEEEFNEMFSEFEMTLLENNVALEVVDKIKEGLAKELVGEDVKMGQAQEKIVNALKMSIEDVLMDAPNIIGKIREKKEPYVI